MPLLISLAPISLLMAGGQPGKAAPTHCMKVAFRVDASNHIGTGHVIRCLTLAAHLKDLAIDSIFLHRAFPDHLGHLITAGGYPTHLLEPLTWAPDRHASQGYKGWLATDVQTDASESAAILAKHPVDLLIVDHYSIDSEWEQILSSSVKAIVVLDDLANRPHLASLLMDQTYGRQAAEYRNLVPAGCMLLTGTDYALLKKDFAALRQQSLERRKNSQDLSRILICMGGCDPDNFSARAVRAVQLSKLDTDIDIMISSRATHIESLKALASDHPRVSLYIDTPDVASLMSNADLAIGAGGTTSWERCCMGLPTIALSMASHQQLINGPLHDIGAILNFDNTSSDFEQRLCDMLLHLSRTPSSLENMTRAAKAVCDGNGASRVADAISTLISSH